jgi:DNA-directed RNA polymerase subunit delta
VGKMYAVGENFEYLIEDEELDISVIGDIMLFGDEYLIGEDLDGNKYVFIYREDEEMVELLDDEDEATEILDDWEDEYFAGGTDIGDWDDDSYYEREDGIGLIVDDTEEYFEVEDYTEADEDVDSFISGLMGG